MFDRLEVSKLDGSDRKVLFSTRLINPRSIVVHPEKGYVNMTSSVKIAFFG